MRRTIDDFAISSDCHRSPVSDKEILEVVERSARVSQLLRKSASLWLEVAREVTEARNVLSKDGFELFLAKSSLTRAIADKMPRIAQASILYLDESKEHLEKLEGWTTLYEVAKLPDADVRELYRELQKNPEQCLTRSFIQQFKSQQNSSQRAALTVATITLSEDDIKRLDYDEYLRFRDALDAIQRIVDRSIIAARMTLHTKSLEKVEAIIIQQSASDVDDTTEEHAELIELRALPAANTVCSDISTQTH